MFLINKKMDISTEQCYAIKFCTKFEKSKGETIALLEEVFQILVVSILKM